jgi:hypothetical protein
VAASYAFCEQGGSGAVDNAGAAGEKSVLNDDDSEGAVVAAAAAAAAVAAAAAWTVAFALHDRGLHGQHSGLHSLAGLSPSQLASSPGLWIRQANEWLTKLPSTEPPWLPPIGLPLVFWEVPAAAGAAVAAVVGAAAGAECFQKHNQEAQDTAARQSGEAVLGGFAA